MNDLPLTVLVIEDEPADADFLQELLCDNASLVFSVIHVPRLAEAIDYLRQHSVDVILLDLSLPDSHGVETISRVHELMPLLPIVVLTGLDDESIGVEAVRRGAQDYLVKGQIDVPLLTRSLRYAIERVRTRQVMNQQAIAIASSQDGIAMLDAHWVYTYANQAFAHLYGYDPPDAVLGTCWREGYNASELARLAPMIEIELQQSRYWNGEAVGHRRNGELFHQELSITALDDGSFLVIVRDISDRKRAEESLLLTRFALDQVNDAVFLTNPDAYFFYVNEAACRLLGYSQAELLQMSVFDVDPNFPSHQWEPHWQMLKERKSYLSESTNQAKDGRLIPIEFSANYLQFNGREFKCTIVRNISARKAAEKALEASERKFRTLVSNIPGIIYRAMDDARWTPLFVSDEIEKMLGYPTALFLEQRSLGLNDVTFPEDRELVRQRIHAALAEKRPFVLEYRLVHRDGSIRWVREQGQGVWAENGHLLYLDGVIFDITSRRKADAQIIKLNRDLQHNTSQLETANRELSRTKEFLASVLNNASDPIFVKDVHHRWILMNQKFCDLVGADPDSLQGKSDYDLFPEAQADAFWQSDNLVLVTGEASETEDYVTAQDGTLRFISIKKSLIVDSAGHKYIVGIIRDLTRRKHMEEALRDSEERFRQLAENIDDVFRLDDPASNRAIYVSNAYAKIWGRSPEALQESLQPMLEAIHPDDREQAIAIIHQRGHQPYDIEYRIVREDGSIRWIRDRAFHIYDSSGRVYRVAGIASDVTDQKLAEVALRESEARLQAFLDNADTGIFIKDLHGRHILVNHCCATMLGRSVDEMIGKTLYELLPEAMVEPLHRNDRWVIDNRSSLEVEEMIQVRGRSCTYLVVKFPLFDHKGNLYAIGGISTDITMRKQAEIDILRALEREKELNELKSRFISTTSHEFRTPLTTILGSTELLEYTGDRWPNDKKLKHYQQIKNAVQQMTHLLEDILTFSRGEAGKLTFTPSPTNLESLCQSLVEELQAISKSNQIIHFSCQGNCNPVDVDEKLLRQILTNLLSNALKYSPEQSTVELRVLGGEEQIKIQVQDHGIGIPDADLNHLFHPFHRGKNVGAITGTGLGLAIVKRAIDLHGGQIVVESQVGVGTLCSVTLPRSATPTPTLTVASS